MASVRHLISNVTAGEFSPRLYGRPDIEKYRNAVAVLENFTVVPHGGARKRSGFRFVIEVKDSDDPVRLVPFQYNVEQTYMLVLGPGYIWFCKDQGIITHSAAAITAATNADPCVMTAAGHDFSNGDRVYIVGVAGMHQVNNRHFTVANATMDTFELSGVDSSSYGTYGSGGQVAQIVELATGYTADEIEDLQVAQSADTLYIAHVNHPLAKITRTSHTAWTLAEVDIVKGPFRDINPDANLTLTPSSFSASATGYGTHQVGDTFTLTASSPMFDEDMVGGLWRLSESSNGETGVATAPVGTTTTIANNDTYTVDGKVYGVTNLATATTWEPFTDVPRHDSGRVRIYGGTGTSTFFDSDFLHDGTCIIRITGHTSATVVTGEIVHNQMPASIVTNGTSFWEEGAFSTYRGFARCITFYEQRLFLASTLGNPQTVWSSRTGAYEDFESGADDDDAIIFTISSGLVDYIRWISGGRVLSCGTASGEFAIAGTSSNDSLTPTNVRAVLQTTYGSSSVQPVRVGQIILYPQRAGDPDNASRKLREFAYQYENDTFASSDLTVFSEHVTGPGYDQLAYQVDPDSIIWTRRTDGTLAAVTYERDQKVIGWHRHEIAGTSATVENAASVPGADGDELWAQTARTINGGTKRYVEVLQAAPRDDTAKEDMFYVDCGLTYDGASTTTIGSLWHLEGESVDVLNNGAVERGKTVSNGAITLTNASGGGPVHVGKRISAVLQSLDLEAGAQGGTAQSRKAKLGDIFIRLHRSLGGTVGPDATYQDDIEYRTPEELMGSSPALFSGLKRIEMPGGWRDDSGPEGTFGRIIRMEHDDPLPFFVTGIVAEIQTTG